MPGWVFLYIRLFYYDPRACSYVLSIYVRRMNVEDMFLILEGISMWKDRPQAGVTLIRT
jgi:hypothetical protein